jgi:hypothetical protein
MNPTSFPSSTEPSGDATPAGSPSPSALSTPKQGIKEAVRSAADNVKTKVSETADDLKHRAADAAQEKRRAAADRVTEYSSAIHETADSLKEKDPNISWFTHRAADRLQGVADYVRDRDFRSLKNDVENIARRHPVAFFGGLFVAGLVIGNIVKATAKPAAESSFEDDEQLSDFPDENSEDEARPYSPLGETETPATQVMAEPASYPSANTPSPRQ